MASATVRYAYSSYPSRSFLSFGCSLVFSTIKVGSQSRLERVFFAMAIHVPYIDRDILSNALTVR
jgi:hypothetical protein